MPRIQIANYNRLIIRICSVSVIWYVFIPNCLQLEWLAISEGLGQQKRSTRDVTIKVLERFITIFRSTSFPCPPKIILFFTTQFKFLFVQILLVEKVKRSKYPCSQYFSLHLTGRSASDFSLRISVKSSFQAWRILNPITLEKNQKNHRRSPRDTIRMFLKNYVSVIVWLLELC